jgi:hypothetical protein
VDSSAVAEALGGHLSPAENSLGEEAAALRDGHMGPESLLHEVNGETLINPTATAGKHQAAVKAHLTGRFD